jgi:hypothetical protein
MFCLLRGTSPDFRSVRKDSSSRPAIGLPGIRTISTVRTW